MFKQLMRFFALSVCILHGNATFGQSDLHSKIMAEFAPIYERYSPLPLRPLRQSELHHILLIKGYRYLAAANDYFLQGPQPTDGKRRTEYVVIPKFCKSSGAQDPYVAQLTYSARAVRGRDPARMLRALRRTSIIAKHAHMIRGDGYENMAYTYTGATSPFQFFFELEVTASKTYNQKIVFATYMKCP